MKIIRIVFGALAAFHLLSAIVMLFNQPFATGIENDRLFAFVFVIGLFWTIVFLAANRRIEGTAPGGTNRFF